MYIENIQTPHNKREQWPNEVAQPVNEYAKTFINQESDPSDETILLTTAVIQQGVRRSLWYEEGARLNSLVSEQAATCIGYSVVGSEALESAGVHHWVGFANGHAFLLVPTHKSIWLVDMLSPELNQEVQEAISYGTKDTISEALQTHDRAVVKLHTEVIARNLDTPSHIIAKTHPWFLIDPSGSLRSQNRAGNSYEDERRKSYANQSLILSIFSPARGREVLISYARYKEALSQGSDVQAVDALKSLSGFYPDIDARGDSLKYIRQLVRRLSHKGATNQAKEAVDYFFSSFSVSNDTRLAEKEGDCLRIIAKQCLDNEAAKRAYERYESVKFNPRSFGCVAAKATIAKQMVTQLDIRGDL